MQAFDRAMNHLDKAFGFVDSSHQYISRKVRSTCCETFEGAVGAGPPVQWPSKGCCVSQAWAPAVLWPGPFASLMAGCDEALLWKGHSASLMAGTHRVLAV